MSTLHFKIEGMDCAEEVAILKRTLGPMVEGEDRLAFDILSGKMSVTLDRNALTPEAIVEAVAKTGMRAIPWNATPARVATSSLFPNRYTFLAAISGAFWSLGFVIHSFLEGSISAAFGSEGLGVSHSVPLAVRGVYLAGVIAGVWLVLPKAWFALRSFRPDMNLLMIIAVGGAIFLDEWFEAATVAFLFAVSLALESWSIGRARKAVEALLDLTPTMAWIRQPQGGEVQIDPSEIAVDQIFLVKPSERIPLDGEVLRGGGHINQAPITGESTPVEKFVGDAVFAGTINGNEVLEVRATKPAGESTLAHIIRLVGDAQAKKAPSEQWVERFARIYTPSVLAIAFAIALLPPLFMGHWPEWFYRALVLLVIACPCALVISTPVTIVAALAAAARQGVLIKGGMHVESPSKLQILAFDKTGTLTEGKPQVQEVAPLNGHTETELLERAASLESHSEHPLAKAILAYAKSRGIQSSAADDFQIIPGKGATGRFKGREFWLGSHRYLEEKKMETPEIHARLEELAAEGRSVVVVGNDAHVCGFITVADTLRPNASAVINSLREAGIQKIVMLSGDNRATAEAVGRSAGVDEVSAELLPAEKVTAIEALMAQGANVGMVGDGVNDAPALARATMGIAMGAIGTDAAIETADVALMSDNLSRLPWLIHHSRRAVRVVRQNIVFALSVKAAFTLLTVFGIASMWAAIAADMGASLLVIFNGLRLLRTKSRPSS